MKKHILILVTLLSVLFVQAQDSLSIEQAIETGLTNNFQIQISNKNVDVARNNNTWGAAGAYPTISLIAYGSYDYTESQASSYDNTQTIYGQPYVDLSWTVFNGFKISTTKAKLANLQIQSEGNAAIVVENSIQSILLAYYVAKLYDEALQVSEEVLELSRDRYNYILAKKSFGNAVTFDVLQAKSNYLADSASVLRQHLNYDNSIRNLNLILALPTESSYTLISDFDPDQSIQEYSLGDMLSKMESNNKTLKNQYIYQEILKKDTRINRSQLYPTVSLGLDAGLSKTGYSYNKEAYSMYNGANLGADLTLSWTLSNGGNVKRAIENSLISEEIGELVTEEMRRTLHNELFKAHEEYKIRQQLQQVAELSIESAKLSLQIAEEKFKSGSINSFNYRDIQIIYLNAANELLQSNYNLIESYTALLRLTGGIITEYTEE